MATRYWINPLLAVSPDYATTLQQYYDADITQLNFEDANGAAQMINGWVRDATRDNIKSIVQPGILNYYILKFCSDR